MTPRTARPARPARLTSRRGFTLIELVMAMVLTLMVFGMAVPFFRAQTMAMSRTANRLDVLQSTQYAAERVDQEIRAAGTNIATGQPILVQARTNAITINGDVNSYLGTNLGAIYYDEDADTLTTEAMRTSSTVTLPLSSSWTYPRRAYGGYAETVSYWLTADTVSNRSGDLMLMRRVNAATPRMVARSIVIQSGDQPFRYFKSDTTNGLVEIPAANLPIWHDSSQHGTTVTESAQSKRIDSVRVVRIKLTGIFHDPRGRDVTRTVERTVKVTNTSTQRLAACGDPPDAPNHVDAYSPTSGVSRAVVTWHASDDDGGGAGDVELYAIWRRLSTSSTWSQEPIITIPAGTTSYEDTDVTTGETWVYGVSAIDCSRGASTITAQSTPSTVTIN